MKNIFNLKIFKNNLKHLSLSKFNTNITCKNYSLIQSQITTFDLCANPSNLAFNTNNSIKDTIDLSLAEEIQITNINKVDQDQITSDILNPLEKIDENPIVSIDLKGRNSKTPKRANHGARPCSSVMRRLKSRAYYKKPKVKY